MAKRNRKRSRVRTQHNGTRTDRTGEPRQETATPENKRSDGAGPTNRENEAQKPQFEWITVEHRDAHGNPTLPKELISGTFLRRYEEVPEGTEIRVLVLAGYKPNLMMVERKIYEIRRLSVRGWRRSGQIAVEMDGWRQHEADWFNALRGVPLEVSDPGLPGPHNEKTHYIVLESSFQRKIVESVDERGSKIKLQLCEGTLDITETLRSAWQRQAAEVLNMGFKHLLLPVLSALFAGLAVWWIVSSDDQDSAIPQRPAEHRLQGDIGESENEPSDRATNYPPIKTPPKPMGIEKRDSTINEPKGEFSAERSTGDGKEVRRSGSGIISANPGLEGHTSELPSPASARQEQQERVDKGISSGNE